MATPILMPALSPTMEEGTLAKWLVAEGGAVAPGDVIAEIETDKATMEVEAVDEGTVGKILVAAGTEGVKVNSPIAILLAEGEDASAIDDAATAAPPPAAAEAPPPPAAESPAAATAAPPAAASPLPAPATTNGSGGRVLASPLARRMAAEAGLDLSNVPGSGPHGRVVRRDVESALSSGTPRSRPAPTAPLATSPDSDAVKAMYEPGSFEEIPLDNMRATIARRLVEAKQTIPHFYLTIDVEIDRLLATRGRANKLLEERGVKLSVNDYIIKAAALALRDVPDCNVAFAGDRLLRFHTCDVAVAVAIEGGLFTPVVRAAETKPLAVISAEMKDLAGRARERRLAPHEYQGGAMAISNLGMFGIRNFDAVINPPHGSILALGAGEQRAVVRNGEVQSATMMTATLSVDHRAIDGALGARFLQAFRGYVEDPAMMSV